MPPATPQPPSRAQSLARSTAFIQRARKAFRVA